MRGKYDIKISVLDKCFSYIVTHSDMTFDLYGRKLNLTKGKKIEFVDVMKELDKELDLYHYYEKTIISFYTRFIMYDKKYEPTSISIIMQIKNSDEKYMQIDNYAQKQA